MLFFFVFRLVTSLGPKKILNPHEESNLRPSDCYFEVLTNIEWKAPQIRRTISRWWGPRNELSPRSRQCHISKKALKSSPHKLPFSVLMHELFMLFNQYLCKIWTQFSQITNARRFNEKSALHNINQTCLSLFRCESFQLVN